MKRRGLEYLFYETSACSGQNLDDFAKQFGMCLSHTSVYVYSSLWSFVCVVKVLLHLDL